MREPPSDLSSDDLRKLLAADYGLAEATVTCLPLGHDSSAWVYRAHSGVRADYFVKARATLPSAASLVIAHQLEAAGITGVAAPLPTVTGELSTRCGRYFVVVYTFVAGETGMHVRMTDDQWVQFGCDAPSCPRDGAHARP